MDISKVVKGQEVRCPDGIGRVKDFNNKFPHEWIQVETYFDNRGCKWSPHNVKLLKAKE